MPIADLVAAYQGVQGQQTLQDFLSVKVEKAFLENLNTGENQEFLLNPPEFTEQYEARYKRQGSIGLSHERMQFVGNTNAKIDMEVMFDELTEGSRGSGPAGTVTTAGSMSTHLNSPSRVEQWRRFLISLVYPRRAGRLPSGSPPSVLFFWPGIISMRVRLTKVTFRHILFKSGRPEARAYLATISLEEDPLGRIFSRDVSRVGTIRPWAASSRPRRR